MAVIMIPCPGDALHCCPQGAWLGEERAATSRVVIWEGGFQKVSRSFQFLC